MFKLLIVDDEPLICEGIAAYTKMWRGDEMEWARTAAGGEEAWSMIEEEAPDILITDIRMPHGDGIALLQRIRGAELPVKAVVLSGYQDFEYVRKMALLGIENYLLKPVNEEELASTLSNTLLKIQKEQVLMLEARIHADLIRENIINRWMYGAISENELEERAEFLNLNLEAEGYTPCCIRVLGMEEERNANMLSRAYDICKETLSECPDCYFSRNYNGDTIAVFCMEAKMAIQCAAGLLNECLEKIGKWTGQKAYVLLGKCVEDYWKVAESFKYAITNGVHMDCVKRTGEDEEQPDNTVSPFSLHLAQYVLEHYREDLSLKTMASHFRGNAAYIGQVFKRDMHKSFNEYLKDVRLEKAKEILLKSDVSAKEAAQRVGFANTTYFCTVFKKETGFSPDRYRKEFGKG